VITLLLPAHTAGRLTTMSDPSEVPWNPDFGFTVSELGIRLRNGGETVKWLKSFGMYLEVLRVDHAGTWFELDPNWKESS